MTTQMPPTEQIKQAWESVTPRFDECVSPLTMTFGQAVVDKLGVGPGTVFLDVGAGSGALAIPAAPMSRERGSNFRDLRVVGIRPAEYANCLTRFVASTIAVIGANAKPVCSGERPCSRWKNRLSTKMKP